MKKIAVISLILIFAFIASSFILQKYTAKANALGVKDLSVKFVPPDDNAYFWFDVRVKVKTRDNIYRIISVNSRITQGSLKQFDKAVWKGLSKRRIVIGPFVSIGDAQKSQMLYRAITRARTRDDLNKAKLPKYENEIYWFALKFTESPRLRIFIIEHSPARVESGSAKDFLAALYETLTYQQIIIGPFEDYQRTEEIKRIYRQNE